jgi:peptidyl-prolyl cis-trans isomerase C
MKRMTIAVAAMAALCSTGALAQAAAPAKPAPPAKATAAAKAPAKAASTEKTLYTQAQFDLVLKQQLAKGGQDSPELRNAVRENLNTLSMLASEAKKKGLDKEPDVKTQLDLNSENILANVYVGDWLKKNPVPEADLKKDYDAAKAQMGDKEYKVRHILVDKEDEAKEIIAELQKGANFADLAKARSKDPGSKDKGGELGWQSPAGFVKPFADAMKATPKGKFSAEPVHTQFGWHVLEVEDVRAAKVPSYEEAKPRLEQQAQGQWIEKHIKDLRAKNGI